MSHIRQRVNTHNTAKQQFGTQGGGFSGVPTPLVYLSGNAEMLNEAKSSRPRPRPGA